MKTKIFTLLVVATMFTTQCLYAYDALINGIAYNLNKTKLTAEVTSLNSPNKYSGNITIPSTVNYSGENYSVTSIGSHAFEGCTGLTSINIPNSVTSIGYYAFEGCTGLTSINIPNSVTSIGYYAFEGCTGLTSINIPNSVTSIEGGAFAFCTGLNSIFIELGNPVYDSRDNCNAIIETATNTLIGGCNNTNIPSSVTSIGEGAFIGCTGLTSINIPNSVTSIGAVAFEGCTGLTSINIPNGVTSIGEYTFYGCTGLTSINIPNSVTSIEAYTFYGCTGITSINIPNSVTSIGSRAFEGVINLEIINNGCRVLTISSELLSSSIKSIKTINSCASFFDVDEVSWYKCPNAVLNIKITSGELTENAFAVINRNYKTLKTLDIENAENTELSDEAIKGCYNLENLKLPKNLTKIGYMAMAECMALKEVNIPSSVTEIGDRAFENCRSMKTLTFGDGSAMKTAEESQLQRIGNWSFYNCHELQNLDIPEGVTEIGLAAFYGCTYLQNLTLPSTLRTIGDNTFAKCEKLAGLRCAAEVPPTIDAKTFEDVDRTIPVTVPQGSLKAYKEDIYWSEFVNLQEETTDAKEIPAEFENVSVTDGTVTYSGEKPFCIHNLNGQDVTNLNGSLNGIHIVTIGTASQNMLVK